MKTYERVVSWICAICKREKVGDQCETWAPDLTSEVRKLHMFIDHARVQSNIADRDHRIATFESYKNLACQCERSILHGDMETAVGFASDHGSRWYWNA